MIQYKRRVQKDPKMVLCFEWPLRFNSTGNPNLSIKSKYFSIIMNTKLRIRKNFLIIGWKPQINNIEVNINFKQWPVKTKKE